MTRIIPILLVLLIGCKKAPERTCWKKAGTATTDTRELPSLPKINIYDDVDVVLKQDSLNFIEIESYRNLISFITTTSNDTAIEIRNLNKCNSLRKGDIRNTVIVHFSQIDQLNFYGSGKIRFEGTVYQDRIDISSYNSRSEFNLTISCNYMHCAFIEGSVIGTINGTSDSTYIFQSQYSIVDASNLNNSYLHFSNNSTGDAHVNVTNDLRVELLDVGNIYYTGNPTLKILADIGLGNIIAE